MIAARRAFEASSWAHLSPHARTRTLLRIADKIELHAGELAAIETLDNGMPLWFSTAIANAASDIFRYYAGWCSKINGTTEPSDSRLSFTHCANQLACARRSSRGMRRS
ncbi:aldehyde dehydrogenase family protein [Paraburkholderia piptadeniae]|uniref:aldehyde dehydrogenase family protein n=1 Tax=Paraburkholderia piptadeniae TaxID=1701573 RepID=UPI0022A87776|nr:aldehyde dehydrogenase family protein [Paraburkholderia piptadeniae]